MDDSVTKIFARDLNEAFFARFQSGLQYRYDAAFAQISGGPARMVRAEDDPVADFNLNIVRRMRRDHGKLALLEACQTFKVPYEVKTLSCNGQQVMLAQLGELLLMAEPMDHLGEKPISARYKQELAASHFASRQLEFDFGDGYRRSRIDPRNTLFTVLRHGMHGETFNRKNTTLSMLQVSVPNWGFDSWTWSANAMNDDLSYLLEWKSAASSKPAAQEDKVKTPLKPTAINLGRLLK